MAPRQHSEIRGRRFGKKRSDFGRPLLCRLKGLGFRDRLEGCCPKIRGGAAYPHIQARAYLMYVVCIYAYIYIYIHIYIYIYMCVCVPICILITRSYLLVKDY